MPVQPPVGLGEPAEMQKQLVDANHESFEQALAQFSGAWFAAFFLLA